MGVPTSDGPATPAHMLRQLVGSPLAVGDKEEWARVMASPAESLTRPDLEAAFARLLAERTEMRTRLRYYGDPDADRDC